MTENLKLDLILQKEASGEFELYACRGKGKGCKRNKTREKKAACEDCMGPLPEHLTLEEVYNRLNKGDA